MVCVFQSMFPPWLTNVCCGKGIWPIFTFSVVLQKNLPCPYQQSKYTNTFMLLGCPTYCNNWQYIWGQSHVYWLLSCLFFFFINKNYIKMPVHTNAEINVIVRKVILSKCKLQTSFSFFFFLFFSFYAQISGLSVFLNGG